MIDIHAHLLPGVDDGAKDMDTSLAMFRMAAADGITEMILTPHHKPMHHNAGPEKIKALIAELEPRLAAEGISIQLYPGNEILYSSEALPGLDAGEICTLAEGNYVLLEFHPEDGYERIRGGIYRIMAGGYRPILAHVERYIRLCEQPPLVEDLVEMGCYIQVNAGSILGKSGFGTRRFTRRLLKQRLVHFVSTDAHDTGKRSPQLADCAAFLTKKYGEAYAEKLLYENPMHVLRNEYL